MTSISLDPLHTWARDIKLIAGMLGYHGVYAYSTPPAGLPRSDAHPYARQCRGIHSPSYHRHPVVSLDTRIDLSLEPVAAQRTGLRTSAGVVRHAAHDAVGRGGGVGARSSPLRGAALSVDRPAHRHRARDIQAQSKGRQCARQTRVVNYLL